MTVRELINFLLGKNMDEQAVIVEWEELNLKEYEIAAITSGQNKCNIFLGKRVDNKVFSNMEE